jgi:glyoxylase-like metal-dependent hydrolase (beta-lactamase superfamily II)
MTLDGTNTWVITGGGQAVVIDPGPDHPGHLLAVLDEVDGQDCRVREVLLTHGHLDHSAGAAAFRELTGAPVRALDPSQRLGGEGLHADDVITLDGVDLAVVPTPGHTHDSLTFVVSSSQGRDLLTGDTVLGRGTTVVAHPDGRLGPYLDSLRRLRDLTDATATCRVLPGHGPVLPDAYVAIDYYLRHRAERLGQVREAIADGARTADEVLNRVYADVPRSVWPAARLSVLAQLAYLGEPVRR